MKKVIRIAKTLSFPLDIVTQSMAIIAKRRVGKSYLLRKISEQVHKAGQQICIVDVKGDQWGIRYGADGKSPGLPVFILGGEHGDVNLEVGSGSVVAKLVVEERVSVLLDLSMFRKHEVATFMAQFLEDVYRLKAQEKNRTPLMLIVDEADAIAPQKPQPNEARMLGAMEDIVRRGGQRGIGCMVVTQRSAVLNKNILTQSQVLVALRTIAPQDLKAMNEWIEVHGETEQQEILMESLPALEVGKAWVWSPGWPTAEGIFQCVTVDRIETFDSGATPKAGEKRITPRGIAHVNIDALKRQMADTIERSKADDPKELKLQIKKLQEELKKKSIPVASQAWAGQPKKIEVPVLNEATVKRFEKVFDKYMAVIQKQAQQTTIVGASFEDLKKGLMTAVDKFTKSSKQSLEGYRQKNVLTVKDKDVALTLKSSEKRTIKKGTYDFVDKPIKFKPGELKITEGINLPIGEQAILRALIQFPDGLERNQLTVIARYKRSSRDAYIARLTAKGLVTSNGGTVQATAEGIAAMPDAEPLPTGEELRQHWLRELPEGERKILEVLIQHFPAGIPRETIDDATGYKRSSRDAYIARMTAKQIVVQEGRGFIKASPDLF